MQDITHVHRRAVLEASPKRQHRAREYSSQLHFERVLRAETPLRAEMSTTDGAGTSTTPAAEGRTRPVSVQLDQGTLDAIMTAQLRARPPVAAITPEDPPAPGSKLAKG